MQPVDEDPSWLVERTGRDNASPRLLFDED